MRAVTTILFFLLFAGSAIAQQHEAFIDQIGDHNEATVMQTGLQQMAAVTQSGSHEVFIDQSGSSNSATVNQAASTDWSDNALPDYDNFTPGVTPIQGAEVGNNQSSYATISQAGDGNIVQVDQYGSHHAEITQQGNSNSAFVQQTGSAGGFSFNPSGNGNPDPPLFGSEMGIRSGGFALIHQSGNENSVQLNQMGENYAEISQNGIGNQADVYQAGLNNQAFVNQNGSGHSAIIEQIGTGNTVHINQN